MYWYIGFMLITGTKKSFSALEMQRPIGRKYYEPVCAMMHKIRLTMDKRDAGYKLKDQIEMKNTTRRTEYNNQRLKKTLRSS
jgi:hypothetical protein